MSLFRRSAIGVLATTALIASTAVAMTPAAHAGAPTAPRLYLQGLQSTDAGIAWEIGDELDPSEPGPVYYSAFGGAQDVRAGTPMAAVDDDFVPYQFSLVGKQLYLDDPTGEPGVDITTGAALPTTHACYRTGTGCFFIGQVGGEPNFQYTYTDDATHTTKTYSPPLIDGSTKPQDIPFVAAIDEHGAILKVHGYRNPPGSPLTESPVLYYLDLATGKYTTLDDTIYAANSYVSMDSAYLVWTHDHQAMYLRRDDLSAAPRPAAPPAAIVGVTINADKLAYTTREPDDDSDFGVHTNTIYTGAIGSTDFAQVTGPFCSADAMTPIDNGDFLALAGTNKADYGLYRVTPGQSVLGAPVLLFGFYTAPNGPDQTLPPPDDFCGGGATTAAVIDQSHRWSILGADTRPQQFGVAGDIPAPTDDETGMAHIAVFRPANGTWYLKQSATTSTVQWGVAGDIPVAAQYSGAHRASVLGVFRPSTGRWYVRGAPSFAYGVRGDVPVPGHYYSTASNDHADQAAVFRPSAGTWYLRGHASIRYGQRGDIPVPGDYDGNGTTDIAVYRPSTHLWYVRGHAPTSWGIAGDIPLTADFNGDGRADIAVYRPSTTTWYERGLPAVRFGAPGETPVQRAP